MTGVHELQGVVQRERERGRRKLGVVVRDTTVWRGV
jgi:hypothetical protein